MIAEQLGFLPSEKAALLLELAGEVPKLTNGLCRSLKARLG
jgi:hypothetical protein